MDLKIFRLRQKNAMAVSVPNISVSPSVVHFDDDMDELDNGGENGRRSARKKRRGVTLMNGHRHRRLLLFFFDHRRIKIYLF